ncbi:MAG: hypothetical protein AAF936_13175 [Pseudomonadota bacterium]
MQASRFSDVRTPKEGLGPFKAMEALTPDQDGKPAMTLAAIDPYAIPGWSSSDIVSPDGMAPPPPALKLEERPPLDYDVRLVAYMDCVEGDAVEGGGAAA